MQPYSLRVLRCRADDFLNIRSMYGSRIKKKNFRLWITLLLILLVTPIRVPVPFSKSQAKQIPGAVQQPSNYWIYFNFLYDVRNKMLVPKAFFHFSLIKGSSVSFRLFIGMLYFCSASFITEWPKRLRATSSFSEVPVYRCLGALMTFSH